MKRILSVLLAVLFCVSAFAVTGSAAALPTAGEADKTEDKTFQFGWYPQKRVDDPATIQALNAIGGRIAMLNGETYCSILLTDEAPSVPGNGGYFAMTYGYNPGERYWFHCEPITWRVLESTSEGVLLMAKDVLDTHVYNQTVKADNTWEKSDIRAWLNSTFLNTAFSAREQRYLLNTATPNATCPIYGKDSGNDTVDRVFLPSFDEITNKAYGFNVDCNLYGDHGEFVGYYESDDASGRQATASDYAECRNVWTRTDDATEEPFNAYRRYWLRTTGQATTHASGVLEDGRVSPTGWLVNYNVLGVRPMIRVSPDAVADRRIQIVVNFPEGALRYRNPSVQLTANYDVIWDTSDHSIATVDENGVLTVHDVGTVDIIATLADDPETSVSGTVDVRYVWWQWIIRIVLFGWIWY